MTPETRRPGTSRLTAENLHDRIAGRAGNERVDAPISGETADDLAKLIEELRSAGWGYLKRGHDFVSADAPLRAADAFEKYMAATAALAKRCANAVHQTEVMHAAFVECSNSYNLAESALAATRSELETVRARLAEARSLIRWCYHDNENMPEQWRSIIDAARAAGEDKGDE